MLARANFNWACIITCWIAYKEIGQITQAHFYFQGHRSLNRLSDNDESVWFRVLGVHFGYGLREKLFAKNIFEDEYERSLDSYSTGLNYGSDWTHTASIGAITEIRVIYARYMGTMPIGAVENHIATMLQRDN